MATAVTDNLSGNSARSRTALIAENGAGTYNFDVFIPAGAMISNITIAGEVLWAAATSATLTCGDYAVAGITDGSPVIGAAINASGFIAATNLKATDLTQGQHMDFARPGGKQGTYLPFADPTAASTAVGSDIHSLQLSDGVDRFVRFQVVSVGAGTAGRTYVAIEFLPPAQVTVTQ